MQDLINRQAAIDAVGELVTFTEDWSYCGRTGRI